DRDVESRDRLVGDDQLRAQSERAGDADALPLPARELVGEAVVVLGREADHPQQVLDALLALLAVADPVDAHRVADDRADALARVQARVGVLEDHLHLAAQRPQLARAELADPLAVEDDVAGGRLEQPHDAAAERRPAAAGLADETERLALGDAQRDVVHRVHARHLPREHALPDREVLLQALDLDQRVAVLRLRLGHAGTRASPAILGSPGRGFFPAVTPQRARGARP